MLARQRIDIPFKRAATANLLTIRRLLAAAAATLVLSSKLLAAEKECERIVSLAPSITEMIFDLGLGERLIGATDFCRYPPEAHSVPRIGGYLDLNIERIVASKATTVVGLEENQVKVRALRRFPMSLDLVNHSSVQGIKESYNQVAKLCGVEALARERLESFSNREANLKDSCAKTQGSKPPLRVMVVVGHTREGSVDSGVYISGADGFYSDIISLLGAVNVHQGRTVAVPTLSAEGIMKLAPDVIVDVVNVDDRAREEQVKRFWQRFTMVPAVKQGRVIVLSDDFASIPGPRYVLLAERLAQLVCGTVEK